MSTLESFPHDPDITHQEDLETVLPNSYAEATVNTKPANYNVSISLRRAKGWRLFNPEWMADEPGFRLYLSINSDGFGSDDNARIGIGVTPAGEIVLPAEITISPALQAAIQEELPQEIARLKREPIDVLIYRCPLDSDESIRQALQAGGEDLLEERRTEWGRALLVLTNTQLYEAVRIAKFLYNDHSFSGLWVGAAPTADFSPATSWAPANTQPNENTLQDRKSNEEIMDEEILRDKAAVMHALAAAGVTSVVVNFDGNSDSGQIESLEARAGEITVELQAIQVLMLEESDDETAQHETSIPLVEAIETLCYEYLAEKYEGWEINEGSYGTFTFDVPNCFIELDFNRRFIDEENSSERL